MKIQPKPAPAASPAKEHWLFKPVDRPVFTDSLHFPEDITQLSTSEVSRLHGQYTALYGYAVAELSKADIAALRCRSTCFVHRNNISRTFSSRGYNKYKIDAQVRLDKHMENLELLSHVAEEKQISLKSYVEIFDKYLVSLSREMSRRQSELNSRQA